MVEAVLIEKNHKEEIKIPKFKVEGKENIAQYFGLMLAGTPHLKFSIVDKKGKEHYSNMLNVEMR